MEGITLTSGRSSRPTIGTGLPNVASIGSRPTLTVPTFVSAEHSAVSIKAERLPTGQQPTYTLTGDPLNVDPEEEGQTSYIPEPTIVQQKIAQERIYLNRHQKRTLEKQTTELLEEVSVGEFYGMSFSIFNEKEIIANAPVRVENSAPSGVNSVNDSRFGTVTGNTACSHCTNTITNCPGHLGYIELKSPFVPDLFQKFVVQVLNSICLECKKILWDEEELGRKGLWYWSTTETEEEKPRKIWRYNHENRLKVISELIKTERPKCKRKYSNTGICQTNPYFKKEQNRITYRTELHGQSNVIYPEQILKIFESIPQEDSILLGFDPSVHPKRLLMEYLPVLPICNRPPRPTNGQQEEDELTLKYRNIVTQNNKVEKIKFFEGDNSPIPQIIPPRTTQIGQISNLHKAVNSLIVGPKATEERSKSIKGLVQGKKGLIREHMMGKRGDRCGRGPITPGSFLEFGEIGIPSVWKSYLTIPVLVTAENRQALTELMRAGNVEKVRLKKHAGHHVTITPDNMMKYVLQVGDTVERHLQDGDYIAVNRNPTLHIYSFMGYKVRLVSGLTIRLSIHQTKAHNADFDGDEMNVFAALGIEAIAELQTFMNSRYCIISGQDNKPITGLLYNDLTAAYKLTQDDVVVRDRTWEDAMRILSRNGDATQLTTLEERLERFGVPWKSGKALFSALLPEDLYYKKGNVLIKNGILVRGPVNKDHVGASHRSIAQIIFKNHNQESENYYGGADRAARYLSDSQFVLKRWLEDEPLTTSLSDCYPKRDPETESRPLFEILNNPDKLELVNWDLCQEILERRSKYANFDGLADRLATHGISGKSGQALISAILPPDLDLEYGDKKIIQDGIFLVEIDDRDKAQEIRRGIVRQLYRKYSSNRGLHFLQDLTVILERCLGISSETGELYELLAREKEKARSIFETYGPQLNDPIEGDRARQFVRTQIDNVKTIGDSIIEEHLDPSNNFVTIVSGAKTKGDPTNIGQIMGSIGPQFNGADFLQGDRNIYHVPGAYDPESYGVVFSNFRQGMKPKEFSAHSIPSREGIVDTSIKTRVPGSLSHQIIKNTEDIMVQRDRTVRIHEKNIVQSLYGYTGLNPERMINVTFPEGVVPFFIDIDSVATRINGQFGYF